MQTMSSEEVWDFCDLQSSWAALTTLDQDGFPHTVAIGYFRLDKTIYCGCRDNTQKIRNIDREPKASLMLESGRGQQATLRGVTFQGLATVIRAPQELLELKRRLSRLRGEPEPNSVAEGIAYIRIEPTRILSWTS